MAAKKRNAGRRSIRKTKKAYRADEKFFRGARHPIPRWETSGLKRKKKGPAKNPTVYDAAGKSMGKFKRKAAKVVARVVGGTVGKPKARNPETLLFKTKAAVKKYAKARGLKVKSIRKLKKAK